MYGSAKSVAGVDFRGLRPGKLWPRRSRRGWVAATDCVGVEFGAIRAGGFLSVEAAAARKPWQARTFAAAELAASMTLKSKWCKKSRP